jgi:hypothetical protein
MSRYSARDIVPWLATFSMVGALALIWVWLHQVNIQYIEEKILTQVDRNTILSKDIVEYSGIGAALIVAVGVLFRARNKSIPLLIQEIFQTIKNPPNRSVGKLGVERTVFFSVLKDILLLGKMGECEDFQQWLSHLLTMWGFIGLAVTTTLDAIVNPAATPLPIMHPVRVLGNFAGILFVGGLTLALIRRIVDPAVRITSRSGDWGFLISLYGTGLTGFAVEVLADTSNVLGTWVSYLIHLGFVAFLLITAPWTKFIHALWRPSWLVYTRLRSQIGQ